MTRQQHRQIVSDRGGFTLVELLIVIVIIGLLTTILLPTVGAILRQTYAAKSASRIQSLDDGAMAYSQEHQGNYPGQMDYDAFSTPGVFTSYDLTGSQILAACLFGLRDDTTSGNPYHALTDNNPVDGDGNPVVPRSNYAAYDGDMLRTVTDVDGTERRYTVVDAFPKYKPLLYYMAADGIGIKQFHYTQNEHYTGLNASDPKLAKAFEEMLERGGIVEQAATGDKDMTIPPRATMFILIGPGIDRDYFNEDDLTNW